MVKNKNLFKKRKSIVGKISHPIKTIKQILRDSQINERINTERAGIKAQINEVKFDLNSEKIRGNKKGIKREQKKINKLQKDLVNVEKYRTWVFKLEKR